MSQSERCETCKFFLLLPQDTTHDGLCRRHAPTFDRMTYGAFPSANKDWWCGEYQEKAK